MSLKVAVIGGGNVGTTLGGVLSSKTKHQVIYGARTPEKVQQLISLGAQADTVQNAVAQSDVVVLATPSFDTAEGIKEVAASLGPTKGKIILDATNPLNAWPGLEVSWGNPNLLSGSEVLASALPDAFVYKAFNTVGVDQLGAPDVHLIDGRPLTMLFAGPPDKVDVVSTVLSDMGWAPHYVGPIRYSRNLEAIAELWIHLNTGCNGAAKISTAPNFLFQLINVEVMHLLAAYMQ